LISAQRPSICLARKLRTPPIARARSRSPHALEGSAKSLVSAFLIGLLAAGCGTIPDVAAYLHANPVYLVDPQIVGPHGPLTARQAQHVIDRLSEHQTTATDILARHLELEQALSDVPLVIGNQVTLLKNGDATYGAMLAAIRNARNNINLQMFTFSDGPIGQEFADALIERQQHGVQVNLIYDSLGSFSSSERFFDRLRSCGIEVLQYRPLDPLVGGLWSFGHRDHRKMLIVDGRVAFTGGINISEVYGSTPSIGPPQRPLQYWRDTDLEVGGPAVAEFQRLFIEEWQYQNGPPLVARDYFPKIDQQGTEIVRVIGSVPERFSAIYVTLISAINSAETNVYVTDAYFAPDHQMIRALERAARRGVDVRLLLPSESDHQVLVSAQRSHYAALLRAGVKIYEWRGAMLHAKSATVDGVWSTIGTSNLDWWSIARDNEINAIVLSHDFGREMNTMFTDDLNESSQIDPELWRRRAVIERLDEDMASAIEPLL
jgi:cardiolipin synthase A/B